MDRKEQILEIATELVQTRGYSAFSYKPEGAGDVNTYH